MKKTILFLIGLILAGTLAYYAGYYVYTSENPKALLHKTVTVQKPISAAEKTEVSDLHMTEYYIAKIEQELLVIYKMPAEIFYDSVELSSLHFSVKEKSQLMEGIYLQNLTEVFEFLENSMS